MSLKRQLQTLPDLASVHRLNPLKYPHYLSSAAATARQRFSILFLARGECLELDSRQQLLGPENIVKPGEGFLSALNDWYLHLQLPGAPAEELPFTGGWFLYLAYELAAEVEPVLDLPDFKYAFPVAFAQRCPAAIIIEHQSEQAWLVAEEASLLEEMQLDIESSKNLGRAPELPNFQLQLDPDRQYLDAVAKAREYIYAGDVFQVNLSRAWSLNTEDTAPEPMTVLEALHRDNPAPFAGLATYKGSAIISSSPERLLEIRGLKVQTRPIAGTRPRSNDADGDRALSAELIAHPKERAEHIMLIDLERNDLGRVCEIGSVMVDELMVLEEHPHVHHIVSNICGQLQTDKTPIDAIAAVFPGGTITGCPKVRCMQIIAELETTGRGPYTGSMGYLGRDGQLDLNILIRSLFQQGQQMLFRTGGGIVADSIASAELLETKAKARGLLLAMGLENA